MNKHVTTAVVVLLAAMFALLAGGPLLAPASAAINTTPISPVSTATPISTRHWTFVTNTPTPGRVYQMFEGGPVMYMPSVMR